MINLRLGGRHFALTPPTQQIAEDLLSRIVERFEPAYLQTLFNDQPPELLEESPSVSRPHHNCSRLFCDPGGIAEIQSNHVRHL